MITEWGIILQFYRNCCVGFLFIYCGSIVASFKTSKYNKLSCIKYQYSKTKIVTDIRDMTCHPPLLFHWSRFWSSASFNDLNKLNKIILSFAFQHDVLMGRLCIVSFKEVHCVNSRWRYYYIICKQPAF